MKIQAADFIAPLVALALLSLLLLIFAPAALGSFSDPQPMEDFCPDAHPPECAASSDVCRHHLDSYACTAAKQLFSGTAALCLFFAIILAIYGFASDSTIKKIRMW